MVMSQAAVKGLVSDYFAEWRRATNHAKMLDLWARGEHERPLIPRSANHELRALRDISPTPWGRLLINSVSQVLKVTNQYRAATKGSADDASNSTKTFVDSWKPNYMLSRQGAIYRSALAQNESYVITLPGKRPHTDLPMARMVGAPATKMAAFFDSDGFDPFPRFAVYGEEEIVNAERIMRMQVIDEEATYHLSCKIDGSDVKFITYDPHDVGVTPVHRFAPQLDLDGRATGEIEPFIPNLRRLDQDVFDRLVVQRYESWRVKYGTGMVKPESKEEQQAMLAGLRQSDFLMAEDPLAKFGSIQGTDIEPYIKAHDADVQDLAAVSQTPPHHLLGQIANLSADALAAAEASLMRKVGEYQLSLGQTWDQALRSCSFILAKSYGQDYLDEALDYSTEIRWHEAESRSLSQAADALGKVADQLGVPVEMLWEQLPFWKKEDTDRALAILREKGDEALIAQFMDMAGSANNSLQQEAA